MSQIGAHVRGIPKAEAYTGSGKDELKVIGVTDHDRLARWIDDRRDVPLLHAGYGRLGMYQADCPASGPLAVDRGVLVSTDMATTVQAPCRGLS
jgi:hypothetical protein